jgi:hypothetical protein
LTEVDRQRAEVGCELVGQQPGTSIARDVCAPRAGCAGIKWEEDAMANRSDDRERHDEAEKNSEATPQLAERDRGRED